jgi:methionine biosynthesis protein MetW
MTKNFLYKIKEDIKSFFMYPEIDLKSNHKVDYGLYWSKRRDGKTKATLSSWQKQRADYISEMIDGGSVVMDLGCGDGSLLKYLIEKKSVSGVGVDIDDTSLKTAQGQNIDTIKMNLSNLDKVGTLPEVDYILGLEIIEHLPNTEEFVHSIKDKAKKGLIFSFPNTGYYAHRLRLLFGRFPLQWVVHPGEHLRFWTVKDVKWWVNNLGFKLDKMVIYEGVPFLKKIIPSIFGQGIIIKISPK